MLIKLLLENAMSRPLKIFMRGKRITMLQEILRRMGYPMDDQPGLFGTFTRDAVKDFQKQRDMKVTGQVDEELMQVMQQGQVASANKGKTSPKTASMPNPVNQQQLDALIRLMIQKGLIEKDELEAEIKRPQPVRVTQPPLT